jgi:hypothetical protein
MTATYCVLLENNIVTDSDIPSLVGKTMEDVKNFALVKGWQVISE